MEADAKAASKGTHDVQLVALEEIELGEPQRKHHVVSDDALPASGAADQDVAVPMMPHTESSLSRSSPRTWYRKSERNTYSIPCVTPYLLLRPGARAHVSDCVSDCNISSVTSEQCIAITITFVY